MSYKTELYVQNQQLRAEIETLRALIAELEQRLEALEKTA